MYLLCYNKHGEIMKKAIKFIQKLEQFGYEGYLVGGSVRDHLLKLGSFDIDIATNATPNQIMELFKSVPTGIKYGTVLVFYEDKQFEVTTYRKDFIYNNNRHPEKVVFSNDINEDAQRRDFTINGLYMDKNYQIIDLVNGKTDLDNRIIKTIGNPDLRFQEDALRMLRAFYFVSKLNFDIEVNTMASIQKNGHLIKNISSERVYRELTKMSNHFNLLKAIRALLISEIDIYLPGLSKGLNYMAEHEIMFHDKMFWAFCFYLNGYVDNYWKLSNADKSYYQDIITLLDEKTKWDSITLYNYEDSVLIDAAKINAYLKIKPTTVLEITKKLRELPIKIDSDINITNEEIIEIMAIAPGAWLSKLRKELAYLILLNKLDNNQQEIIEFIKKRKQNI